MTQRSEHDGLTLPRQWDEMSSSNKSAVIRWFQGRSGDYIPQSWMEMTGAEKRRVILHLVAVGSLKRSDFPPNHYVNRPPTYSYYDGAPGGGKSTMLKTWAEMERMGLIKDLPFTFKFHDGPNGGKRILRSEYTRLKGYWLAADGRALHIPGMASDHIRNCVNLLKESHGNLVARSAEMLGKLHGHFSGSLGASHEAEMQELCLRMQKIEVDQLYPVFKELCAELDRRDKADAHVSERTGWSANKPYAGHSGDDVPF